MSIQLWQEESGNITAAIPVINKGLIQRKRDKWEKKHHGKEVFKQKGTGVSVDNVVCTSGGTFALPTAGAAELTDKTYTGSMSAITSGDHTVSAGDVTIDASGYTGNVNYQAPLFKNQNGNINICLLYTSRCV